LWDLRAASGGDNFRDKCDKTLKIAWFSLIFVENRARFCKFSTLSPLATRQLPRSRRDAMNFLARGPIFGSCENAS
jgi:hypothetical protein